MIEQPTLLALLRGLHLASALSMLGTIGCVCWVLPAARPGGTAVLAPLVRLWRVSGLLALLTGLAWFAMQAATIAGAGDLQTLASVVPVVAGQTRYGQVVTARIALLLLATVLAGSSRLRTYLALLLACGAVCLQGLVGHAGAIGGAIGEGIVLSESLHLIAAGIWLGGLVPLWLCVGRLPGPAATAVCERFSPIGLACVLVIAGTGLAQGIELIGGVPALVGTRYGRLATLKIGLFLVALGLAAFNRLWLTDRLAEAAPFARARLRRSLAIETLVGLAIILTAGFLASTSPGVHDQPVWPFPWRFSLVTVDEDVDFRREVIASFLLIGLMVLLTAAAIAWGRFRLMAAAVLAGTIAWRAPSFALLTVEAYPTSFQTSPTGFAADTIVRGQALYRHYCVSCHGASGEGDGPASAGLRIKPADLTMPHLWDHADGELFWWLTHGMDDPEGGLAMPGFAALAVEDRWALIDYIRAHNAAIALRGDTAFDAPIAAPATPVRCSGLSAGSLSELRGSVVHVVSGGEAQASLPPQAGIKVVTLNLAADHDPPSGSCIAASSTAWDAYAILADLPRESLSGTDFLIDPDGWVRSVHSAGVGGGWHTRDDLIAAVRSICANPRQLKTGGDHAHHH